MELVDKTGEKGNKITLLEDKYSGAGIYEGILTGAGELGTAGKDKIGMLVVDKLNGATVDGTLKNQVWTYSDDVTNLYMQYVKVLVNNKGRRLRRVPRSQGKYCGHRHLCQREAGW